MTGSPKRNFRPLYVIDHEALCRLSEPLDVVVHLVDCVNDPTWSRRRLCRQCETWQTKDGLDNYPRRPGAPAPHESCNGCWYAYLDDRRLLEREAKRKAGRSRPVRRRKRLAPKPAAGKVVR